MAALAPGARPGTGEYIPAAPSTSRQCHHHTELSWGEHPALGGSRDGFCPGGWVLVGSSAMERGWEESKERGTGGKALGRTGTPLFTSPRGFPPSLSKDAREAAAAAPQHFHPTLPGGLWTGAEWGAQHPAPPPASSVPRLLPCFSGAGGYGVSWDGCTGSGQTCFCGRKGVCVCVGEGLLLIMCTLGRAGLVVGAQDWTREPQVPQPPAGHIIPPCLRFPRSWRHKWLSCRSLWDLVGLRELAV